MADFSEHIEHVTDHKPTLVVELAGDIRHIAIVNDQNRIANETSMPQFAHVP